MKRSKEVKLVGDKLLNKSCEKAIERSKSQTGNYKNVKCSFKSAKKFRESLKKDEKFMYMWYDYTKTYLENGKELAYRPVIDRINEKGNY
ncbi:hypothetical protein [Metabacillus elymi]|uniref:Phage protein n=1 Tax=Metabacillus elymi TaxID=2745198 RepID=A0ABX6S6B7_9BACI|nr:hypothetical protein [Metabacillus sp. KUDC1714]QNF29639.1 hypothetical protein HUW50_20380 [Metabacillus sp. KUDC1714]